MRAVPAARRCHLFVALEVGLPDVPSADKGLTVRVPAGHVHPRVLVIEDGQDTREVFGQALTAAGFDADTARDAADALEALAIGGYQVVVADHRLPLLTGIDRLAALRGASPRTPVIVCSGVLTQVDILQARELGAFAILEKPWGLALLVETVWAAAYGSR